MSNVVIYTGFAILAIAIVLQSILLFYFVSMLNKFMERIVSMPGVEVSTSSLIGELAPSFHIKNYDGKEIKVGINNDFDSILIFISSTCSTCKNLINSLDFQMVNKDRNLIIIGNNKDFDEKVIKTLKSQNIPFTVSSKLFEEYIVTQTPTMFYINKSGIVKSSTVLHDAKDVYDKIYK